jgi:hypothetical protein
MTLSFVLKQIVVSVVGTLAEITYEPYASMGRLHMPVIVSLPNVPFTRERLTTTLEWTVIIKVPGLFDSCVKGRFQLATPYQHYFKKLKVVPLTTQKFPR